MFEVYSKRIQFTENNLYDCAKSSIPLLISAGFSVVKSLHLSHQFADKSFDPFNYYDSKNIFSFHCYYDSRANHRFVPVFQAERTAMLNYFSVNLVKIDSATAKDFISAQRWIMFDLYNQVRTKDSIALAKRMFAVLADLKQRCHNHTTSEEKSLCPDKSINNRTVKDRLRELKTTWLGHKRSTEKPHGILLDKHRTNL